ncbi:TLC domain-containing protein [Dendryphion nanum]|uniref:TLC domain-containing protein n=1 Tax=Dendryphion nanum TaxID=256645 RepID=A0A9P9IPW1_9PLEO|nr:TLC domain-containing protein [Dendryphion nanum]
MHDPIPPSAYLVHLTKPYAEKLSLNTFPYHAHEVLLGFFGYHFILYYLSPTLSQTFCPKTYRSFNKRTRLNWDIHWVSMVQAIFINTAALYVIFTDQARKEMDWKGRLWGYTPASGMVQGFAAGYFLWDLQISIQYIALSGPSALLHAIGALAVTCIGFRPFGNYYGLSFVLYELSTPFLNIHWFCDKLNLTGSRLQLYNGIALLATFFGCRIVWGTYQSALIYSDIYIALTTWSTDPMNAIIDDRTCISNSSGVGHGGVASCEFGELPIWLVTIYLIGNTALTILNFYWFHQMVKAVRKRFKPATEGKQFRELTKKGQ